jgi:hypothetical protein
MRYKICRILYHVSSSYMGSLFSYDGISAGNSAVVSWMPSVVLDVVMIPCMAVVLITDVIAMLYASGGFNTGDRVYIFCLGMMALLLLMWAIAWAEGNHRIVLVKTTALREFSAKFNKQEVTANMLRGRIGRTSEQDGMRGEDLRWARRNNRTAHNR